jgi:hypothetical protein
VELDVQVAVGGRLHAAGELFERCGKPPFALRRDAELIGHFRGKLTGDGAQFTGGGKRKPQHEPVPDCVR